MSEKSSFVTPTSSLKYESLVNFESTAESNRERKRRYCLLVFGFTMLFVVDIQETIYIAALWPYVKQLDRTADETFFGFLLSAFSATSALSCVALGWLSNRMRQTKAPLLMGLLATILGNMGTVLADNFSPYAKWALMTSRVVTGAGTGCKSVIFAFVVMCTTLEERTVAMSIRSAILSAAFLAGPGLAAVFSSVGYPGVCVLGVWVNMFTCPALFSICLLSLGAVFLMLCYRDCWVSVHPVEMQVSGPSQMQSFDKLPAVVLVAVFFTMRFAVAYDQSIGAPLTMTMFNWTAQEAIRYNGIIQSATGALDFAGNLFVGMYLLKFIQCRYFIPVALASFGMFFVVSFPFPSLPALAPQGVIDTDLWCPYPWCECMTRIYIWQYVFGYVCIFAALSFAVAPTSILYSQLFGPRKQGLYQGAAASFTDLGAAVAPVVVTSLFQTYGPRIAWLVGGGLVAFTLFVVLLSFKRLITFEQRLEKLQLSLFPLESKPVD